MFTEYADLACRVVCSAWRAARSSYPNVNNFILDLICECVGFVVAVVLGDFVVPQQAAEACDSMKCFCLLASVGSVAPSPGFQARGVGALLWAFHACEYCQWLESRKFVCISFPKRLLGEVAIL